VALPVVKNNPLLRSVYTLEALNSLPKYDWVINLQRPEPPESFLRHSDVSFTDVMRHLSLNVKPKLITGRHFERNLDIYPPNPFSYRTEIEELFHYSLLPYSHLEVTSSRIYLDEHDQRTIGKFNLKNGRYLGIFLGSNSTNGDDNGQRTYSVGFVENLIRAFKEDFTIVVVGQSEVKSPEERRRYCQLTKKYPEVVNLVDQTTLDDLLYVIKSCQLFISCDSGPFHIAMALQVPVIGLYVNAAAFRVSPRLVGEKYALVNSFDPCLQYSWRWKHHCFSCQPIHSEMYGCHQKEINNKMDLIPMTRIKSAAEKLLGHQLSPAY